ncbi:MAG TPA: hypothetical protein VEV15_04925 [Flavisolibacter sp.]|nr:hypothetical protein [Flavisolibacter sp.]
MLPVAINTISAFSVSSYPNMTKVSSGSVIQQESHPQFNHNGGTIAAPDGLLYVSIGHGGHKNDPGPGYVKDWCAAHADNNGQQIEQNFRSNVLCIDLNTSNAGKGYFMPPGNPLVGKADERKPEREVYVSTSSTGTGFCSYEKPALKSSPRNCKPMARILGRIQAERFMYRQQETLAHQVS